jgi:hypothetical protein
MRAQLTAVGVILCGALAMGAAGPGIEGTWAIERNELKSPVTLKFTPTVLFARAGCLINGRDYKAAGGQLTLASDGIESDTGCIDSERRPAGWSYWRRILTTVSQAQRYRIDGDVLTLFTPDGRTLVFHRLP